MIIKTLQVLEAFFESLETWAGKMRERCAFCPDCKRNRYAAPPCVKFEVSR